MTVPRILFSGGGTGGHVTPALAVAESVRRRFPGADIRFVGTARGVEARLVPEAGYPFETIPVIGLKRELHPDLVRFPWLLLHGLCRSVSAVRGFEPQAVFCTGGYVSGPIGIAAWLLRVPLVLHEQNSLPGLTVRVLSHAAVQVNAGFEEARRRVGGRERMRAGNPTRGGLDRMDRGEARGRFGLDPGRWTLLVVGGSQGARGINLALAEALPALMERDMQVIWQSGRPDYETVSAAAAAYSDRVAVRVFIDDMAAAYSAADLAVTRAGGMTLAELARYGVPAVLVPLPTAAENHQEHNARSLVRSGAARMVRQADLDGKVLETVVSTLMEAPQTLAAMGEASRKLAAPDAADRIVTAMVRAGLLRN